MVDEAKRIDNETPEDCALDGSLKIADFLLAAPPLPKKRKSVGESIAQSRALKKKLLSCTACSRPGAIAELSHPILRVPLCGGCYATYRQRDTMVYETNEYSCVWCGEGDGANVLMCDSCPLSYCRDCVRRNFGERELDRVLAMDGWTCYRCAPPECFQRLQVSEDLVYYSLYSAYTEIKPPQDIVPTGDAMQPIIDSLSAGEKIVAALFSDEVLNISTRDLQYSSYLSARDIFAVIFRISKPLRKFFLCKATVLPGLFQTDYGREFQCSLHAHQRISLNAMLQMEKHGHEDVEFGSLRGGFLGDEPGLGKTVTVLALISASAGTLPSRPRTFWAWPELEEKWALLWEQHRFMLAPLINQLRKTIQSYFAVAPPLEQFIQKLSCGRLTGSLREVHDEVKAMVKQCASSPRMKDELFYVFETEWNRMLSSMDAKQRSRRASSSSSLSLSMVRERFERELWPSSATLIICPMALLEHWYEQILRHLGLDYFAHDEDRKNQSNNYSSPSSSSSDATDNNARSTTFERQRESLRGLVYLDGLGDIVDVEPPISRLSLQADRKIALPPHALASYLIVITTLERCVSECRLGSSASLLPSPLLRLRWLRLIVDEGHELGKDDQKSNARRKSSSGTTSDANNDNTNTTTVDPASKNNFESDNRSVVTAATANSNNNSNSTGINAKSSSKSSKSSKRRSGKDDDAADDGDLAAKSLSLATQFISSIAAERRWIMSGTPTTGAHSEESLRQLFRLLVFLRHPTYTMKFDTIQASEANWEKHIVTPCVQQSEDSWREVIALLRRIMVRHTKSDIKLFDPIFRNVNLVCLADEAADADLDADQRRIVGDDRAKARHIFETLSAAYREYKQADKSLKYATSTRASSFCRKSLGGVPLTNSEEVMRMNDAERKLVFKSRPPKGIVFSQFHNDLQGVGHFLYQMFGESAMCEHFGAFQSSELSRFRHNKRKFRQCPLCGHANSLGSSRSCERLLLLVEYADVDDAEMDINADNPSIQRYPPCPAGHGGRGPGGHYRGRCYCSPLGCAPWESCEGFPNAFCHSGMPAQNPNFALVAEEHIAGYTPGGRYRLNDVVVVLHADSPENEKNDTVPVLWRGGRLGGRAVVRGWRKCGGTNLFNGWHGPRPLQRVPWSVREEDTRVLLLQKEGSTGLDLSFATHIFLLERVSNPGLRNQIISRAHRVGATGPVQVELLQVITEDHEHLAVGEDAINVVKYS